MIVSEIQIQTFPNQTASTTINDIDVTFDILTFGNNLIFNAYQEDGSIFEGIRLPIDSPLYIKEFDGYLYFTGSYDWKTLNIFSFLYFIEKSLGV